MDKTNLSKISDIIKSALKIYATEITEVAKKYNVKEYANQIIEIEKKNNGNPLFKKNARSDLFEKYSDTPITFNGKIEFFISYSSKDKKMAGKIKERLVEKNFEVFLAHRDIPLSEEWRNEIYKHLTSCMVLLAVCTQDYECSAWGNQEVGIAMEIVTVERLQQSK